MKRLSRAVLFLFLSVSYSVSVYGVVDHNADKSRAAVTSEAQVMPAADLRVHVELQMIRIQAALKHAKGNQVDHLFRQLQDESQSLSQN